MRVRLTNSSVMPRPGNYQCREIPEAEFSEHLVAFWRAGLVTSYVGYPANQLHIHRLTGIEVPLNREPTELEPGDWMLCMKMAYELQEEMRKRPTKDKTMWQYRDGPRSWKYYLVKFDIDAAA